MICNLIATSYMVDNIITWHCFFKNKIDRINFSIWITLIFLVMFINLFLKLVFGLYFVPGSFNVNKVPHGVPPEHSHQCLFFRIIFLLQNFTFLGCFSCQSTGEFFYLN